LTVLAWTEFTAAFSKRFLHVPRHTCCKVYTTDLCMLHICVYDTFYYYLSLLRNTTCDDLESIMWLSTFNTCIMV